MKMCKNIQSLVINNDGIDQKRILTEIPPVLEGPCTKVIQPSGKPPFDLLTLPINVNHGLSFNEMPDNAFPFLIFR
jgi:hypothetical protein